MQDIGYDLIMKMVESKIQRRKISDMLTKVKLHKRIKSLWPGNWR